MHGYWERFDEELLPDKEAFLVLVVYTWETL